MPKKTKKEKIIATYRKKLKLLNIKYPNKSIKKTHIVAEKKIQVNNEENSKSEATIRYNKQIIKNENINYFFKDLKKSLILSGLIIVIEIFIYFVRIIK